MSKEKFKLPLDYIQKKVKSLKPYSTEQEKNVLLSPDENTAKEILALLSDVKVSSEPEALYFLLKLREISVSDILEGMIECPSCQAMNQFEIELNEDVDVHEDIPVGIFTEADDIIDTDELPILEINDLQEKIMDNNKALLNLSRLMPCRVCKKEITVDINPRSILSNTTLANIYQEYFLFGKFLHYSNRDVDYLKPFERGILFNLLKKDVETAPQVPKL